MGISVQMIQEYYGRQTIPQCLLRGWRLGKPIFTVRPLNDLERKPFRSQMISSFIEETHMELVRFGRSYTAQSQDAFYRIDNMEPAHKSLQVTFHSFGQGYERSSAFGIFVRWQDVEAAIQAFSEMGHPDAIRMRNALDLASAVERAGWRSTQQSASS